MRMLSARYFKSICNYASLTRDPAYTDPLYLLARQLLTLFTTLNGSNQPLKRTGIADDNPKAHH